MRSAYMDSGGEPSRSVNGDVNLFTRSFSFSYIWRGLWSQHSSDVDRFENHEDDDVFFDTKISRPRAQSISDNTHWKQRNGRNGPKLLQRDMSALMAFEQAESCDSSMGEQQPATDSTDTSRVALFTVAGESLESINEVGVGVPSCPSTSSESEDASKLHRLPSLHDFAPAGEADHSPILSMMKRMDRRARHFSADDRKTEFRQTNNDAPSYMTRSLQLDSSGTAGQNHCSVIDHDRSTFLGLPGRVAVSKREINMMAQSSF